MRALYGLPAPAKLNWFLHVTGRRADGYHTLQTVFQFIDWSDSLDLIRRDDGVIRRVGGDGLPEDDLCVRAARLLQTATGCRQGVDIHLRKSIPQQAGLGGGSSDAATVLIGLNRLWRLGLPRAELMRLGARLGADVPVFVYGRNAWAQGVGDALQAVDLPTPWFAVVHPEHGLSTREVFAALALTNLPGPLKITDFAEWLKSTAAAAHTGGGAQNSAAQPMWGRNDLQQAAQRLAPDVALAARTLREVLLRQGLRPRFDVRMTGSGSAVFAWLDEASQRTLHAAALQDTPAQWQSRLCKGLAVHPLHGWVDGSSDLDGAAAAQGRHAG
ncbi:MAG: 4-(cytidine 5'-diphospho)-2-C-methyl-D-erythritol kinase [Thiomonas sp.]